MSCFIFNDDAWNLRRESWWCFNRSAAKFDKLLLARRYSLAYSRPFSQLFITTCSNNSTRASLLAGRSCLAASRPFSVFKSSWASLRAGRASFALCRLSPYLLHTAGSSISLAVSRLFRRLVLVASTSSRRYVSFLAGQLSLADSRHPFCLVHEVNTSCRRFASFLAGQLSLADSRPSFR